MSSGRPSARTSGGRLVAGPFPENGDPLPPPVHEPSRPPGEPEDLEAPGPGEREVKGEAPLVVGSPEVGIFPDESPDKPVADSLPVDPRRVENLHRDLKHRPALPVAGNEEGLVLAAQVLHVLSVEDTALHVDPVEKRPSGPEGLGVPRRVHDPHVGPAAGTPLSRDHGCGILGIVIEEERAALFPLPYEG